MGTQAPECSSWSQQRAHVCEITMPSIIIIILRIYNVENPMQINKQTISSWGDSDTQVSQPNQREWICISKNQLSSPQPVWCWKPLGLNHHLPSTLTPKTHLTAVDLVWQFPGIGRPPHPLHKVTWAGETMQVERGNTAVPVQGA